MNKLNVLYRNKLVGILFISEYNKKILFQYDEEWVKSGFSISPLSLPLRDEIFACENGIFDGLFGVFADSLPDSWGQLLFNKFIKEHNLQVETILDKLAYVGHNGMGALEYEPCFDDINNSRINEFDFDQIQKDCNLILDSQEIDSIDDLYHLGSSSGGARPKILIKYKNKDLIVKFSSKYDSIDIARKEYEYMTLAKKCGINIPHIELLKTNKGEYFAIERFDRVNGYKIHMISVAALLECDFRTPCLDYVDLLKLTKYLTHSEEQTLEMYRRMVFNVVFGNQDDHAKNFSFLYDEETGNYKISPAYDLTPGKTYFGEQTTSVNGKGKNISDEDMLIVAKKAFLDKQKAIDIIKTIKEVKNSLK